MNVAGGKEEVLCLDVARQLNETKVQQLAFNVVPC